MRSFIPRPWQSKRKGKQGKGQKGKGKGDVEMGGAGYVGQDYDYSYYDPANEYWNVGFSGSLGCVNEWLGLTPNNSAQTLEVITPLPKDESTCVGNVRPQVSSRISNRKTCVGNIRPQVPVMLEPSSIIKRVRFAKPKPQMPCITSSEPWRRTTRTQRSF